MAQSKNYLEPRYTMEQARFVPDPHASTLLPHEFDGGTNIYADKRGIRKVLGEVPVLSDIPGTPIAIFGGYRTSSNFEFVVATAEGNWYRLTTTGISNITPGGTAISGYTLATQITGGWVGSSLIVNDTVSPPMFLRASDTELQAYDTTAGFVWNYDASVTTVEAGGLRPYNSPKGNLLVAFNLTFNNTSGTVDRQGNTVRWSQRFGTNPVPTTWALTEQNIANEVDMPLRGFIRDAVVLRDKMFFFSEIDVGEMYPLNYTQSNTPQFGVKLHTKGRGLFAANCVIVHDNVAYGIDNGDIWAFNGTTFQSIAEDTIKDYFFEQFNGTHAFVIHNYEQKWIEFYYSTGSSTSADKMLAYKYEEGRWMWPRDVADAHAAVESPFVNTDTSTFNVARRKVGYVSTDASHNALLQKDRGLTFATGAISASVERTQIGFSDLPDLGYSSTLTTNGLLPELNGTGTISVSAGGAYSTGGATTYTTSQPLNPASDKSAQYGVNSVTQAAVRIASSAADDEWELTALTWQLKTEGGEN